MAGETGDPLTGWATVALAVVTLLTLLYTVWAAGRDRRDAEARSTTQRAEAEKQLADQRANAEKQLADERAIADQRLVDERAHTEKLRQRERQQDSARRLLERIAALLPLLGRLPDVARVAGTGEHPPRTYTDRQLAEIVECEQATERLRFGGVSDVPGLGDARAAEQYRTLVHLVLTAAHGEHQADVDEEDQDARHERTTLVAQDLLRYATFVRLSLEHLIEHGESLDAGAGGAGVSFPMFRRRRGDQSLWSPTIVPQNWPAVIAREPGDPQYRPAR